MAGAREAGDGGGADDAGAGGGDDDRARVIITIFYERPCFAGSILPFSGRTDYTLSFIFSPSKFMSKGNTGDGPGFFPHSFLFVD